MTRYSEKRLTLSIKGFRFERKAFSRLNPQADQRLSRS